MSVSAEGAHNYRQALNALMRAAETHLSYAEAMQALSQQLKAMEKPVPVPVREIAAELRKFGLILVPEQTVVTAVAILEEETSDIASKQVVAVLRNAVTHKQPSSMELAL